MKEAPGARILTPVCLAIALAWSGVVFLPILDNFFLADDFGNIFLAANAPALEYILEPAPGHLAYVPRLCVYLLYHAVGPEPWWFFASTLVTHLLNVALLFAVVRRLTHNEVIAGLAAALWGSLRVNEGTLGWYNPYGQVIATTMMLGALYGLVRATERATVSLRQALTWYALLLLACMSFGTAMSVAFLFPFAAWAVLPDGSMSRGARRLLWSLPLAVPLGYAAAYGLYYAAYGHDDKQATFIFGTSWRFIGVSAFMAAHMLRAGATALAAGVTAMPEPASLASFIVPAATAGVLIAAAHGWPGAVRRWTVTLCVLAASVYVVIALGRVFTFTRNPAAGAWIPRYHYVSTFLLVVALAIVLARALERLGRPRTIAAAALTVWLGSMAAWWTNGDWVIDPHAKMRAMTEFNLNRIRNQIKRAPPGDTVFIQNQPFQPDLASPFEVGGWAGLFSIFERTPPERPVRFIEHRPEVRARATPGGPMAAVIFPPG